MVPWPLGHMFVEKSINFEDFILTNAIFSSIPLDFSFSFRTISF